MELTIRQEDCILTNHYPPLGLAYIGALLKKEGYDVQVHDLVDTPFEEAKKLIEKQNPNIVGISCNLTDYRWGAFKLAQIVNQISPNIKVVMGGSHATHLYDQIFKNFPVDVIVRFEGELTFRTS